jgi:hypothetical protein
MVDDRYNVVWTYSDIRGRWNTLRLSGRLIKPFTLSTDRYLSARMCANGETCEHCSVIDAKARLHHNFRSPNPRA